MTYLLKLLSTAPSVPEKEEAVEMQQVVGHVELESIDFSYEKNKGKIAVLKGEWSFSAIDQILIDELVFYIQTNNLKAD